MINMKKVVVVILLFLNACVATTGSQFSEPIYAHEDEAVVYFYRPKEWVAGGLSPTVLDNGLIVSKLSNGGYFRYNVNPGKHQFFTDSMYIDKPLILEVKQGENHFVRLDFKSGAFTGTWMLNRVFPDQGLEEISKCKKQIQ